MGPPVAGRAGGGAWPTISNREVGLSIFAASRTLANSAETTCAGDLGAVERRRVELKVVLAAAREPSGRRGRRLGLAVHRRSGSRRGGSACGSPAVISTRSSAVPNDFEDLGS